jgi:SAM-dependent methyltransferase
VQRFTDPILGQLRRPHGPLAPVTAALLNVVNRPINRWAVSALEMDGSEDVLDVGFGGGVGISLVLERLSTGRLTGIEISDEMVRRGRETFADEVGRGALRLLQASVDAIPLADASFDRVYTVNTIFFWPDMPAGLAELHRVLRPGGRLVVAAPPVAFPLARAFGLSPSGAATRIREVLRAVEAAGFSDVRLQDRLGAAALILASR